MIIYYKFNDYIEILTASNIQNKSIDYKMIVIVDNFERELFLLQQKLFAWSRSLLAFNKSRSQTQILSSEKEKEKVREKERLIIINSVS